MDSTFKQRTNRGAGQQIERLGLVLYHAQKLAVYTDHNQLFILPILRKLVRMRRLELPRLAALEPKSSASTNSATSAHGTAINTVFYICRASILQMRPPFRMSRSSPPRASSRFNRLILASQPSSAERVDPSCFFHPPINHTKSACEHPKAAIPQQPDSRVPQSEPPHRT